MTVEAKLLFFPGQADPGWWVLTLLKHFGLVWSIKHPQDLADRPELVALSQSPKQADVQS